MQASRFAEHNIVHVIGFLSHTSTGEVVDYLPHSNGYVVEFEDGEVSEFAYNELRLANDQELFAYLQGRDVAYQRRVILQQPGTQLTAPDLPYASVPLESDMGKGGWSEQETRQHEQAYGNEAY